MQTEDIRGLVGKSVKDLYGRHIGFILGFSIEGAGKVKDVAIDIGSGQFREYPGSGFVIGEDGLLMVPQWKVDTESLGKESVVVRKRIDALRSLVKDGEVTQQLYESMTNKYDSKLKSFEESYIRLSQNLETRIKQLDSEIETIERFLVDVRVQHRSGEIDDESYEVISANCSALRAKNLQEKEELTRGLKSLAEPLAYLAEPLPAKVSVTISEKRDSVPQN
jgi:hypothetical protein